MHAAFTVEPHFKIRAFLNGSVREPYKRSLYERTLINETSSRNMVYQLSYQILNERGINANAIVYVDVIVNQGEY